MASTEATAAEPGLERRKHVGFYLRHLSMLPQPYTSADSQRMTLAYFALSSLDLLGAVEEKLTASDRAEYADWIYEQQCTTDEGGGFRGSPTVGTSKPCLAASDVTLGSGGSSALQSKAGSSVTPPAKLGGGNLAMTYTALLSLAILRDDFKRLDRAAVLQHLRSCQQRDGSFAPSIGHREYDCRFVFCAFAICWMLNDWTAVNIESAIAFLRRSRSWDASFGQSETQEGHGGSTYCAVAALALANRLDVLDEQPSTSKKGSVSSQLTGGGRRDELERWLLQRQQGGTGFNGRIAKPVDTCYSFWCGAALQILGQHGHIDALPDIRWILSAVSPIGGISKVPDDPPDLMHSYLSTAALALHAHDTTEAKALEFGDSEEDGAALKSLRASLKDTLQPLDPALNLSQPSKAWLEQHLRGGKA